MSAFQESDERLRAAFHALGETAGRVCADDDIDRIWRAVSGDLPAAERRALVDRMATDPACAEAWRLASELWEASRAASQEAIYAAREPAARTWTPSWLGAAAAVFLAVTTGLVFWLNEPRPGDMLREQGRLVVESLVPSGTTLPRDDFRLRWTAGPHGSRYAVRVTTDDLQVLATAVDLPNPEFVVSRARLSGLPPGARVLWQVDVFVPRGDHVSSVTFVARVP